MKSFAFMTKNGEVASRIAATKPTRALYIRRPTTKIIPTLALAISGAISQMAWIRTPSARSRGWPNGYWLAQRPSVWMIGEGEKKSNAPKICGGGGACRWPEAITRAWKMYATASGTYGM